MKQFIQWHNDTFGEKVVKALEKNNFQAYYVATRAAAIEKVNSLIPAGATVGVGGSWTLKEMGIPEQLEKDGHEVYDHNKPGLTMEESMSLRRKELLCDVFHLRHQCDHNGWSAGEHGWIRQPGRSHELRSEESSRPLSV